MDQQRISERLSFYREEGATLARLGSLSDLMEWRASRVDRTTRTVTPLVRRDVMATVPDVSVGSFSTEAKPSAGPAMSAMPALVSEAEHECNGAHQDEAGGPNRIEIEPA